MGARPGISPTRVPFQLIVPRDLLVLNSGSSSLMFALDEVQTDFPGADPRPRFRGRITGLEGFAVNGGNLAGTPQTSMEQRRCLVGDLFHAAADLVDCVAPLNRLGALGGHLPLLAKKVSQAPMSPVSSPVLKHCTRCAELPWVKESGLT
jgi:hypothetical protein